MLPPKSVVAPVLFNKPRWTNCDNQSDFELAHIILTCDTVTFSDWIATNERQRDAMSSKNSRCTISNSNELKRNWFALIWLFVFVVVAPPPLPPRASKPVNQKQSAFTASLYVDRKGLLVGVKRTDIKAFVRKERKIYSVFN